MAFTYDLNTRVGQVRLLAGDTDATKISETGGDRTRSDEEITTLLMLAGQDVRQAAASLLEGKAAEYAQAAVDEGTELAFRNPGQRGRQCLALAQELRRQSRTPVRVEAGGMRIEITDMEGW